MVEFFNKMSGSFVIIGIWFSACYKVFSSVEDSLSQVRKREITYLLKSVDSYSSNINLGESLSVFYSALLGEKQFSRKCFISTALLSLVAFGAVYAMLVPRILELIEIIT